MLKLSKRIQISNITSCSSVQSYVHWKFNISDTSLKGKRAYSPY